MPLNVTYEFLSPSIFDDLTHRNSLTTAISSIANRIESGPTAELSPSGTNTWTASYFNPSTGTYREVTGGRLPANSIRVYVGSRAMTELGRGGYGGCWANGDSAWQALVKARIWGGSLAFKAPWPTDYKLYSSAIHEFGHLLGIGTSPKWFALVKNGFFHGANAVAAFGGKPVPLDQEVSHWAEGVPGALDPKTAPGEKTEFTRLDFAALKDLGWQIKMGMSKSEVVRGFLLSRERITLVIRQMYVDYFGREGDEAGVRFWVDSVLGGMSVDDVASHFILTWHRGDDASWIRRLYVNLLGRDPSDAEIAGWVARMTP